MEAIARAVMSRLLHEPTIRLRSLGERGHASLELVRELFGLSDDEPDARAAAANMGETPDNVRQLSPRSRRRLGLVLTRGR